MAFGDRLKDRIDYIRENPLKSAIFSAVMVGVSVVLYFLNIPLSLIIIIILLSISSWLFSGSKVQLIAIFILLVALPFVSGDQYWLRVIITISVYIILSLGLNVIIGFTGILDLGFIAFYGIGAYTTALLTVHFGLSFWICLPIAILAAALVGVLRGLPALHLSGDYLAIVTLGFGEIVRMTFANWVDLTGGPMGIRGITPPTIFGLSLGFSPEAGYRYYYFLILLFMAISIIVVYNLRNSRVGRAWVAIREDETAASTMGIHLARYKTLSYAVGAAFGGLAGSFFAVFNMFVSPNSFTFFESAIVLCMVVIGGIGSIPGVILGAVLLASFPELLRFLSEYRYLIFGALMVVFVILRPYGILKGKE